MNVRDIRCWRVYDHPLPPGFHVLAERLWPRGIRRADLLLDSWPKELAPSTALRGWFGHKPERWEEFARRYREELSPMENRARQLLEESAGQELVLLYAARDREHNGALVLRDVLQELYARHPGKQAAPEDRGRGPSG